LLTEREKLEAEWTIATILVDDGDNPLLTEIAGKDGASET